VQDIKTLLRQTVPDKIQKAQTCFDWIEDINRAYLILHRPGLNAQDIVDLKLSMIFWRSRLLDRLLNQPPAWMKTEQETVLRVLTALNVCLSEAQQALAEYLLDPPLIARLMASQGHATVGFPELEQQSGPGVDLNIVANRGSSTPYEKWREDDLFTRYEVEEEGVRYRGVSFRPGDVLLANVNLDGNGVYTSLGEPRSFSSHTAFFAMLEYEGKRFPVVIETYEKGVRPVPLSIFLGPKFCSYLEIYRHRDYISACASKINRAAAEFIQSVRGYNFDSEDTDPTYMACCTVGRFMHNAAGLEPAKTISRLSHPRVQSNLAKVGLTQFEYFGPVDFLLNDCFACTGVVDNNQIERLLARELIDREFRHRFINSDLHPAKIPFPFGLNRWGIGQMRKQSLIGKLVCLFEGFTVENLPRGPDDLLAVILIAEKQVGKSIVQTRKVVMEVIADYAFLDMENFVAEQRILDALEQNFRVSWLQPDATPH